MIFLVLGEEDIMVEIIKIGNDDKQYEYRSYSKKMDALILNEHIDDYGRLIETQGIFSLYDKKHDFETYKSLEKRMNEILIPNFNLSPKEHKKILTDMIGIYRFDTKGNRLGPMKNGVTKLQIHDKKTIKDCLDSCLGFASLGICASLPILGLGIGYGLGFFMEHLENLPGFTKYVIGGLNSAFTGLLSWDLLKDDLGVIVYDDNRKAISKHKKHPENSKILTECVNLFDAEMNLQTGLSSAVSIYYRSNYEDVSTVLDWLAGEKIE